MGVLKFGNSMGVLKFRPEIRLDSGHPLFQRWRLMDVLKFPEIPEIPAPEINGYPEIPAEIPVEINGCPEIR